MSTSSCFNPFLTIKCVFVFVFVVLNVHAPCCQANDRTTLGKASSSLDKYFENFRTWEGKGELEEKFYLSGSHFVNKDVKFGATDQVQITRTSGVTFAWDAGRNSVRAIASTDTPTKFAHSTKTGEFQENLKINCLITKDAFYRFEPNIAFGEFKDYPEFGKTSQVVEKLTLEDANRHRTYSYLFDPRTVYEISGPRIDVLVHDLLGSSIPGFWSAEFEGNVFVITCNYTSSASDKLKSVVKLDSSKGFLPLEVTDYLGSAVISTAEWSYEATDGIFVPSRFKMTKYGKGQFASSRGIRITESTVNRTLSDSDFSLSAIGVGENTRVVDRAQKKMSVISNGNLKELKHPAPGIRWNLITLNVFGLVAILIALWMRSSR